MAKTTISTFQLFARFPDQESARVYLESRLWPNGVRCPVCGLGERITLDARTEPSSGAGGNSRRVEILLKVNNDDIARLISTTGE